MRNKDKKYKADELELLSPPGATILATLVCREMSLDDLAQALGLPRREVNSLVSGRQPVTESIAQRLEEILDIDASFWLNREKNYREKLAYLNSL